MRFATAFVAILVVSWASNGEGSSIPEGSTGAEKTVKDIADQYESSTGSSIPEGSTGAEKKVNDIPDLHKSSRGSSIPEGSTGAEKSVKDIADLYESSRIINKKPDDDDKENYEVIAESGSKMSVKDLIASYESFQKSDSFKENEVTHSFPTLQQVISAIWTGKAFKPDCHLCKLGAGSLSGKQKPKKAWWEFLCL